MYDTGMASREPIALGEFYHVFNRGVDKRQIVMDEEDSDRFLQSMRVFNTVKPVGSIYLQEFLKRPRKYNTKFSGLTSKIEVTDEKEKSPLVEIVAYCLNPNHFHFLLHEIDEGGISEFMKRLTGGYTRYFNERHERTGALFQGTFKSVHVNSNEQLLHVSVYVNLNNRVHTKFSGLTTKFVRSSWNEYVQGPKVSDDRLCAKDIVLDQFKSPKAYRSFAEKTIKDIITRRRGIEDEKGADLEGIK